MRVDTFLLIATRYQRLGWSVCQQAYEVVVDGASVEEMNSNALDLFEAFLSENVHHFEDGAETLRGIREDREESEALNA